MNEMVKAYDAFISYRHSELDMFVATTLHKELEKFRLPDNLIKNRRPGEKTRIQRVFRDRDELPIASNLSTPIEEALKKSEFLIVICTPRLPESKWCRREIETFISLHGRERVLAVLAEGEPEESFPDLLCYETVTEVDQFGQEKVVLRGVEPLAADVRGSSKAEIRKKIKEEVLRLAAPMFSCAYDDIRQRHREQKIKKRLKIYTGITAAVSVFGIVSFTQAVRIDQQAKVIEAQYQENLRSQSEILASMAERDLEEGDRKSAIRNALDALPANLEKPEKAVVPEAVLALNNALRIYDNGKALQPAGFLEQTSTIEYMDSVSDKYLFTFDAKGKIWIWDVEEHKLVASYQTTYDGKNYKNTVRFSGDRVCYMLNQHSVKAYAVQEEKELWIQEGIEADYLFYNQEENQLFVASEQEYYILDGETGDIIRQEKREASNKYSVIDAVQLSRDKKTYYISARDWEKKCKIFSVDVQSLKERFFAEPEHEVHILKMSLDGKSLLCGMNRSWEEDGIEEYGGKVVNYSLDTGKKKWEYLLDSRIKLIAPMEEKILIQGTYNLVEISDTDGKERECAEFGYGIKNVYLLSNGTYCVLTGDGEICIQSNGFEFSIYSTQYPILGDNLQDFLRMQNRYLTLEYLSNRILVYDMKVSERATASAKTKEEVESAYGALATANNTFTINCEETGQQAYLDVQGQAIVFEYEDGTKEGGSYPCVAPFVNKMMYSPDGKLLVVQYDDKQVELVDTATFSLVGTLEITNEVCQVKEVGASHIALCCFAKSYIVEKESNRIIATVDGYLAYDEGENVFYINTKEGVYTVPFYSWQELVEIAREQEGL